MHQHVIAYPCLGYEGQADNSYNSPEIGPAGPHHGVVALNADESPRYGKAHETPPQGQRVAATICPSAIPPSLGGTCRCHEGRNPSSRRRQMARSVSALFW